MRAWKQVYDKIHITDPVCESILMLRPFSIAATETNCSTLVDFDYRGQYKNSGAGRFKRPVQ